MCEEAERQTDIRYIALGLAFYGSFIDINTPIWVLLIENHRNAIQTQAQVHGSLYDRSRVFKDVLKVGEIVQKS